MLAPVLLGALLSAAVTLPLSLPLAASAHDLALLGLLGVVQLAIPCLIAVRVARVLSAPEVSLLGLLEVVFGVLWVWLGSDEAPSPPCWAAARWCWARWRPTRRWRCAVSPARLVGSRASAPTLLRRHRYHRRQRHALESRHGRHDRPISARPAPG